MHHTCLENNNNKKLHYNVVSVTTFPLFVLQFHVLHFHVLLFHALRFYVPQIHVLHFHVLPFGPFFSCPAISCPAILMVRHFHVRHFQSTPMQILNLSASCYLICGTYAFPVSFSCDCSALMSATHRRNRRKRFFPRMPETPFQQ